ncbi:MAG: FAD-dependent oxidoreductase, partial [Sphaerochaetaceae bacterium]
DAEVCLLSGAPVQTYKKGNALAAWFYETKDGKTVRRMLGAADVLSANPTAEKPEELESRRYLGLDALETSEMVMNAHRTLLGRFLENGNVSQEHSLATIPSLPQLRMTRRLIGKYTMHETEQHQQVPDSVGLISDWRKNGPIYELPLRCLYSEAVPNLATVGRCISVTDEMWDITRVIPPAVVSGQAAGTVFTLCDDLTKLDVRKFQETLRKDGVIIHEQDL